MSQTVDAKFKARGNFWRYAGEYYLLVELLNGGDFNFTSNYGADFAYQFALGSLIIGQNPQKAWRGHFDRNDCVFASENGANEFGTCERPIKTTEEILDLAIDSQIGSQYAGLQRSPDLIPDEVSVREALYCAKERLALFRWKLKEAIRQTFR